MLGKVNGDINMNIFFLQAEIEANVGESSPHIANIGRMVEVSLLIILSRVGSVP